MTAIVGIVSFAGDAIDSVIEEQIKLAALNGKGQISVARAEGALIARQRANSGSLAERSPRPTADGRLLFAAAARLDNRAEVGAMLSISASELAETSDDALIFELYRRCGERGVARCLGAFAFAAWDADECRLTLGRDCLGDRAMFFHRGDGFVAFANDLRALLALPFVPRELDDVTLANFLALNHSNPRRTFYRGIERVPSRTLVTINRQGLEHRQYWSPNFDAPPPYAREEDYVERARELLDQAVATATADTPRVAISTSGGLDSSAIAATAARLGRAESIGCFCIVPPEGMQLGIGQSRYVDERDKIAALARMYPTLGVEFCVEGDLHPFEEDPVRFFVRTGCPVLGPSNLGLTSTIAARVAATGHSVMLVGNKGNIGLSWTGQFSLLTLLREGKLAALISEVPAVAHQTGCSVFRTIANELVWPSMPLSVRRRLHRLRGRNPDDVARYCALNSVLIAELGLARIWREEGFDPLFGFDGRSPARLRARILFDHNQFARDSIARSRTVYGIETRDPLADRRLLEFLLTVPEPLYRRNGIPRSFARAVLADRLPPEILNEQRRGYPGATWFRRLNLRRAEIAAEIERLESSTLASRLLDVPRLKRLLEQWPRDENAAEARLYDYRLAFSRGIHVGRFIRWVEGGNA